MIEVPDKPEQAGLAVVAVGSFNPAIFHPSWFARQGLIRDEEADSAKIQFLTGDVAVFSTTWFNAQVTQDRFMLSTSDVTKHQPLRDLVLGTFSILEHTPIKAFGLNRSQHYRMASEADWHEVGHFYAPKAVWSELLTKPGLRSMVVEGSRESATPSRVQIKIEPSSKIGQGVFVHVNEHFGPRESEEGKTNSADDMRFFLQTVSESWDDFICYTDNAARVLLHSIKPTS